MFISIFVFMFIVALAIALAITIPWDDEYGTLIMISGMSKGQKTLGEATLLIQNVSTRGS